MKVLADLTNLIRASNFSPYRPGASSIPSSFAMASGFTGKRHMSRAIRCFFARASMSRGTASAFFPLAGFAFEDFPFPSLKLFSGFVINFLATGQATVGPTARKGSLLAFLGVVLFRFLPGRDRSLASQDAVGEIRPQGVHGRLFFIRELGQPVWLGDVVVFVNSTENRDEQSVQCPLFPFSPAPSAHKTLTPR